MALTKWDLPTSDTDWVTFVSTLKQQFPEQDTAFYRLPAPSHVANTIDHTQLALTATTAQIDALCAEAREHHFATICVRVNHVAQVVEALKGSGVGIACVVGFHEGTYRTAEKVDEAQRAVQFGATELDMVINYSLLKEGKYSAVFHDVLAVRRAAPAPILLKVILETSQLSRDEIIAGSIISSFADADYVKTSTGFNGTGATVENVKLMKQAVDILGKGTKVKASGGVRSAEDAIAMLQAGADRIGASAGVKIVNDLAGGKVQQQGDAGGSGY
jgi:deoxyribose-phosphate aldolase